MKFKIAVFILLFLTYFVTYSTVYGQFHSYINVNDNENEFVSENSVEKNVYFNFRSGNNWSLYLKLIGNGIYNISKPDAIIQPQNILIRNHKKMQESVMSANESTLLDFGNTDESIRNSLTLILKPIEGLEPGNYTGNLQLQLSNNSETIFENVHISFRLPCKQELYTLENKVDISIDASNSFKKGFLQESRTGSKIFVKSNSNWKLIISANYDFKSDNYHYFKVLSVPYGAKSILLPTYELIPKNPIAIVEGLPTFSSDGKHLESREIDINYAFKTSSRNFTPSGNYPISVTYSIVPM